MRTKKKIKVSPGREIRRERLIISTKSSINRN